MVLAVFLLVAGSMRLRSERSAGSGTVHLDVTVDADRTFLATTRLNGFPWFEGSPQLRRIQVDPALELLTPRREVAAALGGGETVAFDLRFRVRDCRLLPLDGDPGVILDLGTRWRTAWKLDLVLVGVGAAAPPAQPLKGVSPATAPPRTGPGGPLPPATIAAGDLSRLC